jgi:hypothetical protein
MECPYVKRSLPGLAYAAKSKVWIKNNIVFPSGRMIFVVQYFLAICVSVIFTNRLKDKQGNTAKSGFESPIITKETLEWRNWYHDLMPVRIFY